MAKFPHLGTLSELCCPWYQTISSSLLFVLLLLINSVDFLSLGALRGSVWPVWRWNADLLLRYRQEERLSTAMDAPRLQIFKILPRTMTKLDGGMEWTRRRAPGVGNASWRSCRRCCYGEWGFLVIRDEIWALTPAYRGYSMNCRRSP